MRTTWRRRATKLGAATVLALAPAGALANGHLGRPVVVAPTEYLSAVPTEYVSAVPTSYVATTYPTSYYLPTTLTSGSSYLPTAYVTGSTVAAYAPTVYAPASYVETAYVPSVYAPAAYVATAYPYYATTYRRPWFPRLRGYVATSYAYPAATVLAPTAYEYTYAETPSGPCCQPASPCDASGEASFPVTPEYSSGTAAATSQAAPPAGPPPKSIQSQATTGPVQPSAVSPPPTSRRETTPPGAAVPKKAKPSAVDPNVAAPPTTPAAEKDVGATPISPDPATSPAPAGNLELPGEEIKGPPLAPTDPPAKGAEKVLMRDARRPVLTAALARPYVRTTRQGTLNLLEGKVVSGATGQPEAGVRVTATNRRMVFADRTAVSDDEGHYSVRLPDGDWTVSVATANGKVYPVSELVVSEGQIVDDAGRDIPSLTITR